MGKKQEVVSKRQALREQRLKRQRQQRMAVILGVVGVALVIAGFVIIPSIQRAMAPVGEFVQITPRTLPNPNGTSLGDENAKVLVEVYEDFQCPACQAFTHDIEPRIIENYVATGKARYVFRQYPFLDTNSVTKESQQAANASMCAAEQNRFWDYHDMLFANWNGENQGAFNDKRLVAFAEALGLNMDKFNTCFKQNTYRNQIQQDLAAGNKAGVTGTPSVFVNGVELTPGRVPSYEEVGAAIDAALSSSGN